MCCYVVECLRDSGIWREIIASKGVLHRNVLPLKSNDFDSDQKVALRVIRYEIEWK